MGKYDRLYVKPFTRATSAWANAVVSALNELDERISEVGTPFDPEHLTENIIPEYDLALDIGDPTHRFYAYYGYLGFFDGDLYVQGKRVIKDEDPVNIYDIFPPAQDKIEEAFYDALSSSEPRVDVAVILDPARQTIEQAFYDALSRGIIIAGPTDQYGNVRVVVANAFTPVSTSIHVTANENTSGVELSLIVDGRPNVNVAYYTDTFATLIIEVSNDGVNWFARYDNTVNGSGVVAFNDNAFRWVRARVPDTDVEVYLEISASR